MTAIHFDREFGTRGTGERKHTVVIAVARDQDGVELARSKACAFWRAAIRELRDTLRERAVKQAKDTIV